MSISSLLLSTFELDIAAIDGEHRALLLAIDELNFNAREAVASPWFRGWQQRFAALCAAHFSAEEAWMDAHGIPAASRQRHALEHERMLREAEGSGALAARGIAAAGDVYKLMKVEFFKHFIRFDIELKSHAAYRPPLASQGEPA